MTYIPKPPQKNVVIPKPPQPVKKYTYADVVLMERNKEPPNCIDLEEVVLGALMIDSKGLPIAMPILKSQFFYLREHQLIFQSIERLYEDRNPIDLLTVSEELKRMDKLAIVGGDHALISLTQKVSTSAHIEFHSRVIIQKYVLREMIKNSLQTVEKAFFHDPDIFDVMAGVKNHLHKLNENAILTQGHTFESDAKKELYEKVALVQKGEAPGIPTGINQFDEWCGGFHRRELITLAARPGMGKTTALLSIAKKNTFDKKIPGAFFTLEMTNTDLKYRLASEHHGIPFSKIRQGKITMPELNKCLEYFDFIDNSCLHIVDNCFHLELIVEKIIDLVENEGVKYVVIDYVQLIKLLKAKDKTGDLQDITRELKSLANRLNIPIVIIAQLSRKIDTRTNRRPILSDLKQSGSIEEDSDTVIFLYREAYYQQEAGMTLTQDVIGKTEFIVAKGRNIGTNKFWTFLDFIHFDFRDL